MSDDADVPEDENNQLVHLENGHYTDDTITLNSDSDIDEEDDESDGPEGNEFDKNLPTIHKYLGKMDNVSGYTLYDDGQVINGMLAIYTNTLVFPGFTLPLVLRDNEADYINEDIRKGYTFALICTDKTLRKFFDYGVVMEVFETSVRRGTICLKAKGRQRCRFVNVNERTATFWSRMQKLTVKILAEPQVTSPVSNTQLYSLKSKRHLHEDDYNMLIKEYKSRRFHLSQYPFSSWVYDRNELCFYVDAITQGLLKFFAKERLPSDPIALSYWFVQNYQLTHGERLDVLKCDNVLDRLKLELKFLQETRILACCKCDTRIALHSDVFAMSKDGMQSNYCNPGGNVYETVTVTEAENYTLVGGPSKQFSWFPGYVWTIMQCSTCRSHLGWLFTSRNHQPRRFFGLANASLEIKIVDRAVNES